MKKVIKKLFEIIIFIALFLTILFKMSLIEKTYGKGLNNDRNSVLFYELDKNTVDVMMVGDSHIYHSFISQLIYNQSGITSAIMATSNQSIINSYWAIKHALNRQKPKVIIMDTHSIEDTLRKADDYLHFTSGILALPDFCIDKYYCYKDLKEAGYGLSDSLTVYDVVGLLQFRNDYDREFNIEELINLIVCPEKEFKTFGYYPSTEIMELEALNVGGTYDVVDFEDTITYIYLNKILELCKQNDMELLLTRNLYNSTSANLKTYESIFKWADANDVKYIDYFELIEQLDFNTKTDFCNSTHLNYSGAKKASNYLINFLKNNYNLEDHRNDKKYYLWQDNNFDYESLDKQMNESISSSNSQ